MSDLKTKADLYDEMVKSTWITFSDRQLDRRSGRTTRQVDLAVDVLFQDYIVYVRDHAAYENDIQHNNHLNKQLMDMIIKRMKSEHPFFVVHVSVLKRNRCKEIYCCLLREKLDYFIKAQNENQ